MSHLVAALLATLASTEAALAGDLDAWLALVPGRYALIGRQPDNGAAYTGSAVILARGRGFSLERTTGDHTVVAKGTIEVPSPPGEGQVVRFRWNEHGRHLMTCLVQADLDNYARLSCLHVLEGHRHETPGLEAYFSTEAWPEGAPGLPSSTPAMAPPRSPAP